MIRRIEFTTSFTDGVCTVTADLARENKPGSAAITIVFEGVSHLRTEELGGGISQLYDLVVEDIRAQGWDRLNYRIVDEENGRLGFMCRSFKVVREYAI